MPQENVEVVETYFAAVNREDFAAAMAAYADDVVLVIDEAVLPMNAGTFRGREAVGEWFADWFRSFARGYHFEVLETRSVNQRVLAVARHSGRGRSSGVAIDGWSTAYAFSIDGGRIARLEIYAELADALQAVGLEE